MAPFQAACEALGRDGVMNIMTMVSLNRSKARGATESMNHHIHVFEFPGSMPFDAFQPSADDFSSIDESTRLHPTTCELVTEFVPVANQENVQ